jgi:hypothetical protein
LEAWNHLYMGTDSVTVHWHGTLPLRTVAIRRLKSEVKTIRKLEALRTERRNKAVADAQDHRSVAGVHCAGLPRPQRVCRRDLEICIAATERARDKANAACVEYFATEEYVSTNLTWSEQLVPQLFTAKYYRAQHNIGASAVRSRQKKC